MRLTFLASEFPPGPGGIGAHAHQLAEKLSALGWELMVFSPQDYASDAEIGRFNGSQRFSVTRLRSRGLKPRVVLSRARAVSKAIGASRPDLLVASGGRAVWVAAVVARRHGLPWVAVGHGSEFALPTGWERTVTRWAFEQATAIVCVSQFTQDLSRRAGIRTPLAAVIPNGADAGRFNVRPSEEITAFRDRIGIEADHLILTVGNVTERKGQEVVIRALPEILRRHPRTHYLMVGLPTRREELARLADDLGVVEHAHFLGRLAPDDVVRACNACDVFAMTSRITASGDCEGYGIAAVEAALCGKPAVVSQGSGLVEAIVDGQTGLAVPEGDWRATAAAINGLLDDPERRHALGRAALRRARREQTWEHRVRQYDALFREVLQAPARPAEHRGRVEEVPSSCDC